jgi:thiosulfate reductase cytochrome b subunit
MQEKNGLVFFLIIPEYYLFTHRLVFICRNPLQRLTYLSPAGMLLPVQMVTGILYRTYNSWEAWGLGFLSLNVVALIHMTGAFFILLFVIVHVYMTTTGHTAFAHIKAMITGWEEIEDWEKASRKRFSETVSAEKG